MSRPSLSYFGPAVADRRENEITFTYVATSGQITFAGVYSPGYVFVYKNGLKLRDILDFTATDGTAVVLKTGCTSGDKVEVIGRNAFPVSDVYSKSQIDAMFSNYYGITGGSSNALTVNTNPSFNRLIDGMELKLRMTGTNTTTTPTLNVNSLGAKVLKNTDGSAVTLNAWVNGEELTVRYNAPLNSFIVMTSKPIMASQAEALAATSTTLSMNPARTKDVIEKTPTAIGVLGMEGVYRISKTTDTIPDFGQGYILIARKPFNGAKRTGFTGNITSMRGSSSGIPLSKQAFVNVVNSYDTVSNPPVEIVAYPGSAGEYSLVYCTYSGVDYIAIANNVSSMSKAYFVDGIVSDPYNDGFPKVVLSGSVSGVTLIKNANNMATTG